MKNTYILMPFQFGVDCHPRHELAEIHAGRGKALTEAAAALERKLNNGRTAREWLEAICLSSNPDAREAALREYERTCYRVVTDTVRSYYDYRGADAWPIMKRVDEMNA
jgi:hypothetical protein